MPIELDRRTFLTLSTLGLAATAVGCGSDGDGDGDGANRAGGDTRPFAGRVIVVGAGPAGLTAAHLLVQRGVDVEVLEAAATHGGRIAHDLDFTDFPISLGGEWLHVGPGVLDEIVNDPDVAIETELAAYRPSDTYGYYDGNLTVEEVGRGVTDLKFVGSSWLDFFDTYVLPGIADRISYDTEVVAIDHTGDVVRVTDASGGARDADRVIVTVPLAVLRRGDIEFDPALPDERVEAVERADIWGGMKVFVEFSERFYPTFLEFPDSDTDAGRRLYYDAAYGQDTEAHVLGLFAVGEPAEVYQSFGDDGSLRDHVLAELDEIFDGAASRTYIAHVSQNWDAQPFAAGAYLADEADVATTRILAPPIDGRVFFAGDGYTSFDDWSSVHTAVRSASEAVDEITA